MIAAALVVVAVFAGVLVKKVVRSSPAGAATTVWTDSVRGEPERIWISRRVTHITFTVDGATGEDGQAGPNGTRARGGTGARVTATFRIGHGFRIGDTLLIVPGAGTAAAGLAAAVAPADVTNRQPTPRPPAAPAARRFLAGAPSPPGRGTVRSAFTAWSPGRTDHLGRPGPGPEAARVETGADDHPHGSAPRPSAPGVQGSPGA